MTAPSAADLAATVRESLDASREWRPLLNGEYPPPGPTKYGPIEKRDGQTVRPILVYAPVKAGGTG